MGDPGIDGDRAGFLKVSGYIVPVPIAINLESCEGFLRFFR